jgi:hypothetical protein
LRARRLLDRTACKSRPFSFCFAKREWIGGPIEGLIDDQADGTSLLPARFKQLSWQRKIIAGSAGD